MKECKTKEQLIEECASLIYEGYYPIFWASRDDCGRYDCIEWHDPEFFALCERASDAINSEVMDTFENSASDWSFPFDVYFEVMGAERARDWFRFGVEVYELHSHGAESLIQKSSDIIHGNVYGVHTDEYKRRMEAMKVKK